MSGSPPLTHRGGGFLINKSVTSASSLIIRKMTFPEGEDWFDRLARYRVDRSCKSLDAIPATGANPQVSMFDWTSSGRAGIEGHSSPSTGHPSHHRAVRSLNPRIFMPHMQRRSCRAPGIRTRATKLILPTTEWAPSAERVPSPAGGTEQGVQSWRPESGGSE